VLQRLGVAGHLDHALLVLGVERALGVAVVGQDLHVVDQLLELLPLRCHWFSLKV
jgi:hypothetical protein